MEIIPFWWVLYLNDGKGIIPMDPSVLWYVNSSGINIMQGRTIQEPCRSFSLSLSLSLSFISIFHVFIILSFAIMFMNQLT